MSMGIIFTPKIGDHLRKSKGVPEAFSKYELNRVVALRAAGLSYSGVGLELARGGGSVACAVTYYKLGDAIEKRREELEALSSPCIGVCKLVDDVCVGCDRTIEEIINKGSCPR